MWEKCLVLGVSLLVLASPCYGSDDRHAGLMISAEQMKWREVLPGSPVKMVVLWGDRDKGEYAMLLKLPAGYVVPDHAHTGDYHGLSVVGTWRHSFDGAEQKSLPPGSYVLQPGMKMHGDACAGPEDCILFIHQYVKGDFLPKQ